MATTEKRVLNSSLIVLAQFKETKLSAEHLLSQLEVPRILYTDAVWLTENLVSIQLTRPEDRQNLLNALGNEHFYETRSDFQTSQRRNGNRRPRWNKHRSSRRRN